MIQELTNWTLTSEESMPAEPTTKLVNPTVNPKNLPILTKLLQYIYNTDCIILNNKNKSVPIKNNNDNIIFYRHRFIFII